MSKCCNCASSSRRCQSLEKRLRQPGVGRCIAALGAGALDFVERHTTGYEEWRRHVGAVDRDAVVAATGLGWEQITEAAGRLRA